MRRRPSAPCWQRRRIQARSPWQCVRSKCARRRHLCFPPGPARPAAPGRASTKGPVRQMAAPAFSRLEQRSARFRRMNTLSATSRQWRKQPLEAGAVGTGRAHSRVRYSGDDSRCDDSGRSGRMSLFVAARSTRVEALRVLDLPDHETRRRLPAHTADPGRQGGHGPRQETQRPHLVVDGESDRSDWLAEGRSCDGQQECPHPVGRSHQGHGVRP
jgi:hypothetical protein